MEIPPAWSQVCSCGRTFSVPQAYTYHKRSCQKTKKRLATALEKAKEVLHARKRQKTEGMAQNQELNDPTDSGMDSEPIPNMPPIEEVSSLTRMPLTSRSK